MRSLKAALSSFMNIFNQLLRTVLSLAIRKLFWFYIGAEILGLNSTFSSLISVLSLTELGVGSAIGVCLYKPLAESNNEKVIAYFNLLKKFYRVLIGIYVVCGIILTPFAFKVINGDYDRKVVLIAYYLFLLGVIASYVKSYYRNILEADQKTYVIKEIDSAIYLVFVACQIVSVVVFKNYYVYLIITIVFNLVSNNLIAYKALKYYPWLLNKKNKLEKAESKNVFDIVKNILVYRIANYLIQSVDNMIISVALGTVTVVYYGNYYLIVTMTYALTAGIINGFTAGLGNILYTQKDRIYSLVKQIAFIQFIIYGTTSICIILLSTDFVVFFFGEESKCNNSVVIAMGIFYFIWGFFDSLEIIRVVSGIYTDKYYQLAVSLLNLVISVIFTHMWGLCGVVIGTIVCYLARGLFLTPRVIFGNIIPNENKKEYMLKILQYVVIYTGLLALAMLIPSFEDVAFIPRFFLKGIIGVSYVLIIIILLFRKDEVYEESIAYIIRLFKSIVNKLNKSEE